MVDSGKVRDYILVVDDDEDIRVTLQQILEDEGYQALGAANGEEALKVIRSQPRRPGLVLLDLMMPVMDGPHFQAKLAEDPALASVPVVIISAGDVGRRAASGPPAAAYLHKPIDLRTLIGTVRTIVA